MGASLITARRYIRIFIAHSIWFSDHFISFGVYWPADVHVFINTSSKSTILDFIIYCNSCLGFWFGLSVHSMIKGIKVIVGRLKEWKNSTVTSTAINKSPPSDILSQKIKRWINVIEMKVRYQSISISFLDVSVLSSMFCFSSTSNFRSSRFPRMTQRNVSNVARWNSQGEWVEEGILNWATFCKCMTSVYLSRT